MHFRGYIKDGRVIVDDPIRLPDGTAVDVQPAGRNGAGRSKPKQRKARLSAKPPGARTLYERLKGVIGKAKGLPSDFAAQHDHYIHGAPRR